MASDDNASLDGILAEYIERLQAGEILDKEQIGRDHPDVADELLRKLQVFQDLSPGAGDEPSLGTLGDYTLRRQIGRGGMGVVYEAWQSSMDRRVALKVMPRAVAAEARAVARFIQEAQLAGKLSHPNIVHVHGMGVEQQIPYYAMDYVEGETLAQWVVKLKILEPEASTPFGHKDGAGYFESLARAFADVADALQHAHAKKVIHRDIKPSNLILDGEGRLCILDFGLARLEGQEGLTISGDLVGTPQYMSPEQARRRKVPVDHRTDVYSLGATLYEVLTGRPPFSGKDHNDTLSQIIERDPVEPKKVNPRVPKDLETIVLKCLRKDAADRYGTAEALAQDLRRLVRGDAIEARPQLGWQRLRRRAWRFRFRIATGLLLAAVLVGAGWEALRLRQDALERRTRQYEEKVLSAALRLELASLTQVARAGQKPFWGMEGSSGKLSRPAKLDPVQDALKSLEESRALIPARADAPYHLARALILLGREDEAERSIEALVAARPPFVPAITLEAGLLERRGQGELAESLLGEAARLASEDWAKVWLEVWRSRKARKAPELVAGYSRLLELASEGREPFLGCSLLARLGRGEAALGANDIVQALEDFNAAQSVAPGAALPALLAGKAWLAMGKSAEAEQVFQRLYERTEQKAEVAAAVWGIYVWDLGNQERALSWAERITVPSARQSRRARTLYLLGRYSEAEEAGRDAFEQDPQDHDACEVLGDNLMRHGKNVEAREVLQKGLEHYPDSGVLHLWLGQSYLSDPGRDIDKAISHQEWVLQLPDPDGELHQYAWAELGQCYFLKGDRVRGLEMNRKALELGSGNPDVHNNVGVALLKAGMLPQALEAFEGAIALVPIDSSDSSYHWNKGRALAHSGRLDEALASLQKAQSLLPRCLGAFRDAGRLLELQGKASDALQEYLGAIAVDPGDRKAHLLLKHLLCPAGPHLRADGLTKAVDVLEAALRTAKEGQPERPWISISLALVLASRREADDQKRALEVLLPLLEAGGTGARLDPRLLEAHEKVLEAFAANAPGGAPLALLASLPPYQAIDAALSIAPGPQAFEGLPERFLPSSHEPEARKRLLYLEGTLLARRGNYPSSIEKLEDLARLDTTNPEPVLRLVEVLRKGGRPERAEEVLRAAFENATREDRRLWDRWLAVELVDFHRPPAELLDRVPAAPGGAWSESDYRADVLWLLERIKDSEAIRIRCGGDEYEEPGGKVWGKDRFFLGGQSTMWWGGEIEGTQAAGLYQAERYFPLEDAGVPSAYAIPLPPGSYRVHLHFAEVVRMNITGSRRFDVLIEGKKVLDDFEPMESGFATKVEKVFDARVDDGLLEVRFVHRPPFEVPKVSAIEVERVQ